MILSAIPSSHRGLVPIPVALFAALCVVSRLPAAEPSDCHQIPAGSMGYVHFQVSELDETPLFDACRRLQSRVEAEASAFSLSRLGLDVTRVSEVTILYPPFGTYTKLHRDKRSPYVLIATLSDAFQPQKFASRLSAELGLTRKANNVLTNGDDLAFFVASEHVVVLGTPAAVDWWLTARDDRAISSLAASRAVMADHGQILIGIDAAQARNFGFGEFPAPAQPLSKAGAVTVGFQLDEALKIKSCLVFDKEDDAQHASQALRALNEKGRALLSVAASEMELRLADPNAPIDDCFGYLMGLALIREGAAYLDQVHIKHADRLVHAEARLEMSTTSLVVLGLTAIRSIGAQADARFESVADQLDAQ